MKKMQNTAGSEEMKLVMERPCYVNLDSWMAAMRAPCRKKCGKIM